MRRLRRLPPKELSEAVEQLDDGYVQLLTLLDRRTAFQKIVAVLPDEVGFDVAFVGELQDDGSLALSMPTRFRTAALNGLVVPSGIGLGGKVLLTRRPEWVANYTIANNLRFPFVQQADRRGPQGHGRGADRRQRADLRRAVRLRSLRGELRRHRDRVA